MGEKGGVQIIGIGLGFVKNFKKGFLLMG